jgi:hypothetical protein
VIFGRIAGFNVRNGCRLIVIDVFPNDEQETPEVATYLK